MSIQDPKSDPQTKSKTISADSLTNSVNNRVTNNDEDRLDSIASSLLPFPPVSDDVMETEIESSNDIASDFINSLSPTEVRHVRLPETDKSRIKKRKKQEIDKTLPAVNDCGVTSGGEGLRSGKPLSSGSLGCGSGIDLGSLMDTNRYDRISQGPFDMIIQTPECSTSSIDPIAIGRLLYSISKKEIIEIKKTGFSRISIQLKSREAANNLISNPILRAKNTMSSFLCLGLLGRALSVMFPSISPTRTFVEGLTAAWLSPR